ncbi:MAG: Ribosomal large subunit pseudouridine synthase C [Rhodocyclaceae bacterium]|nr:Ribosomal large subunit pseudouridine synthase C [Rhodocyclaceae bacterium]
MNYSSWPAPGMGKPAGSIFKMKELSKASVTRQQIGEETDGQRIDNYLLRVCKGVPKCHVYRILRSGEVRVNSKRVGPEYRLQVGDEVRIPPVRLRPAAKPAVPVGRSYRIVHEDDALLVIDKPAGMAVHGGSGVSFGVIEQLRQQRPQARFLELAHRLDRETSGLLLVAKKRAVLTALHDLFRTGGIEKRYLALVRGRWQAPERHVRLALHKYLTGEGERRVSVSREGKAAHSIVRLLGRWENFSLVEVELETGRTHQIRVHLSHLGFPLCGDDKYGDFALNKALQKQGLGRMFLHAAKLSLNHPMTGERLDLASGLPAELTAFLRRLEDNERRDYGAELSPGGV